MNKRKLFISGALAVLVLCVGQIIFKLIKLAPYEYSPIEGYDNRYLWLFKDTIAPELKNMYSISSKTDAIYIYKYKDLYSFFVWELSECKNVNIENIKLTPNYKFTKLSPPKTYFSYGDPDIDVELKTKHSLSTSIDFCTENDCEIFKDFYCQNYHCIYGKFTKLGFSNEAGEVQFSLSHGTFPVSSAIVFYKERNSFFIIIINTLKKGKIDERTMYLLNL